jgi:DNA-binding CsgD family transcriptional regulator/tetratricopeptide (TPR) repeat protein
MSAVNEDESLLCVGRDLELRVLEEALDQACHGRGTAVLLSGEDGAGKSRLAREAAASARARGMRVLEGRATSVGPEVPLRPLTEALARLFRDGEGPDSGTLGSYRGVLGRLVPEYAAHGPAAQPVSPALLAESVLRLVSAAGAGRGGLLVLEDLHDADLATTAVVEYLADNIAEQGFVLLATFRSDSGAAWDLALALARRRSATLLRLGRLSRDEVAHLAASRLGVGVGDVPREVRERLYRDSGGNPFIAEEVLRAMVDTGVLVSGPEGCRLVGDLPVTVPAAVGHEIARRAAELGPEGLRLLSAAAVIGERFPVSVLRQAQDLSESLVFSRLRAAVTAGLLTADGHSSDWYAFCGPMTAQALLTRLTPADRAGLARRAAEAVAELHPGLPGQWCRFAAALTCTADDLPGGARLLAEEGRRMLAAGRAETAADLLTRAWELLHGCDDMKLRADVLDELLSALVETGRTDRARQLTFALDELGGPGVDAVRVAALHTRLAWMCQADGREAHGLTHVDAALAVLGPQAEDRHTAQVDAVAAQLALDEPERAERLAVRAVHKAERAGLPAIAGRAWRVRGLLAQQRGSHEAAAYFARMQSLADAHELPLWRMHARLHLAGQEWLASGERTALTRVRRQARHLGTTAVRTTADLLLALDHVLRGEYAAAEYLIAVYTARARHPGLAGGEAGCLAAVRAVCAAHQGRSTAPEQPPDGSGNRAASPWEPLTHGLAGAVCALLEEDRDRARADLARAAAEDTVRPAPFPLAGQYGLALLLEVLAGETDWARYQEVDTAEASGLRWNRHFVLLARAVLLGRQGRGEEAAGAVGEAGALGQPYPMAVHLGLRLVAEEAHGAGWGDPVGWLRRAEEHFHRTGVPAVAHASRGLLRHIGVVVPHRTDADRVPRQLRLLGVTRREYEVLQLLVDRPDNRSLAARLFISPRTVEKHVASLMLKTGRPNRAELSAYAAAMRGAGR